MVERKVMTLTRICLCRQCHRWSCHSLQIKDDHFPPCIAFTLNIINQELTAMSHEAKKTDTDLEAAWVPLRRSSPDPHAPNVPSLPVRLGLGFFTSLALLLTLLVVIPTCLIRYATFGPPLKWQPLKTYIEGRFVYWSGRISDSAYLRPPRPVAKVPKNLPLKWAKEGRKDVEVDVVDIPPLQDGYMKGIGKVEGVKGEQRSGYILTSPRSVGRGKDPAKEGERVVLYFHGG